MTSKPLDDLKRLGSANANDRDASTPRSRRNSRNRIPKTHFAFLKKRRISSAVFSFCAMSVSSGIALCTETAIS